MHSSAVMPVDLVEGVPVLAVFSHVQLPSVDAWLRLWFLYLIVFLTTSKFKLLEKVRPCKVGEIGPVPQPRWIPTNSDIPPLGRYAPIKYKKLIPTQGTNVRIRRRIHHAARTATRHIQH